MIGGSDREIWPRRLHSVKIRAITNISDLLVFNLGRSYFCRFGLAILIQLVRRIAQARLHLVPRVAWVEWNDVALIKTIPVTPFV